MTELSELKKEVRGLGNALERAEELNVMASKAFVDTAGSLLGQIKEANVITGRDFAVLKETAEQRLRVAFSNDDYYN